jgi:hypothetical protein
MAEIRTGQELMKEDLLARMEATLNRHQEEMKAQMASLISKMDGHHARTEANHKWMMAKLDAHHKMMMACLGKTEAMDLETNPEETESGANHWEVPKEDATVETGRALNKRHRGQHVATGWRSQLEERTWGNCESHKKLGAACRKMAHHAGAAWCKGNVGKNQTRDKVVQGTPKGQVLRRRHQPEPERKSGIKD